MDERKPRTQSATPRPLSSEVAGLSDEVLMEEYLAGSDAAFALLIRRYEREIFSYLRRVVVDPNLAEDVFQNAFLQVHQKRHLYQQGRPFRPWLYTLATNQAIDTMRRQARHQRPSLNSEYSNGSGESSGPLADSLEGNLEGPAELVEKEEQRQRIRETVDKLPEHLRCVVVLNYYQGMKYKEIADILDIPVGTVKSRLHAAIGRLGDMWQAEGLVD